MEEAQSIPLIKKLADALEQLDEQVEKATQKYSVFTQELESSKITLENLIKFVEKMRELRILEEKVGETEKNIAQILVKGLSPRLDEDFTNQAEFRAYWNNQRTETIYSFGREKIKAYNDHAESILQRLVENEDEELKTCFNQKIFENKIQDHQKVFQKISKLLKSSDIDFDEINEFCKKSKKIYEELCEDYFANFREVSISFKELRVSKDKIEKYRQQSKDLRALIISFQTVYTSCLLSCVAMEDFFKKIEDNTANLTSYEGKYFSLKKQFDENMQIVNEKLEKILAYQSIFPAIKAHLTFDLPKLKTRKHHIQQEVQQFEKKVSHTRKLIAQELSACDKKQVKPQKNKSTKFHGREKQKSEKETGQEENISFSRAVVNDQEISKMMVTAPVDSELEKIMRKPEPSKAVQAAKLKKTKKKTKNKVSTTSGQILQSLNSKTQSKEIETSMKVIEDTPPQKTLGNVGMLPVSETRQEDPKTSVIEATPAPEFIEGSLVFKAEVYWQPYVMLTPLGFFPSQTPIPPEIAQNAVNLSLNMSGK